MNVLGIVGSLREKSYNKALMGAFIEEKPESIDIVLGDIGSLPLFNDDVSESAYPETAQTLKAQVEAADRIIIISPEYNRSVPGVLKNAIDWVSRPKGTHSFAGKKIFIAGASSGMLGTAVAQYDLRRILVHEHADVYGYPELMVGMEQEKFNAEMQLTDETTRTKIREAWVKIME